MKQLILVDACNVIHRLPALHGQAGAGIDILAGQLLQLLRPIHDVEKWELHLVVDGRGPRLDQQFHDPARTLSILFSPAGFSADSVIESWLIRLGPGWSVRVASEDRAIRHTAIAHNAEPLSAGELLQWAQRARDRHQRQLSLRQQDAQKQFGNRLEGLS